MNKYIGFGEKWKKLNHLPTMEHQLFFQYLLISPSYYLAHKVKTGESICINGLEGFNEVLITYEMVGDIFEMPFEVWWESKGEELFYSGNPNTNLYISLDLTLPKDELLNQVNKKIDTALYKLSTSTPSKLTLLNNKVETFSIYQKHILVEEKARTYEEDEEKLNNWQIALVSNLESKWAKKINIKSKPTSSNQAIREYLTMLVSKNLSEALVVAENAARRKFPSKDKVNSDLKFDYKILSEILANYDIAEIEFRHEVMKQDKEIKFREYWEVMNKKIRAKRKAKKKLDILIQKEIKKRESEEILY